MEERRQSPLTRSALLASAEEERGPRTGCSDHAQVLLTDGNASDQLSEERPGRVLLPLA
jgi:hypothetical protein